MNIIQRIFAQSIIYGLSSVIGRAVHYMLVPLYTAVFLPAEYSKIGELYGYISFLQIIYTYGIETAYFRFASFNKNRYFNVAISATLFSSVVLSGILVFFATPIANTFLYPNYEVYIYLITGILTIDTLLVIPFAKLKLENRSLKFALIKITQVLVNVVLNMLWLYFLPKIYHASAIYDSKHWLHAIYNPDSRMLYIFFFNIISNAIAIPLLLPYLRRVKFTLQWHKLQPMLYYALPLFFMNAAKTINDNFSRVSIRHYLPESFYYNISNETVIGSYMACYKLSVIMTLCIQAFAYAAEPVFFSKSKIKDSPVLFSRITYWFIVAGCSILFAFSVNLDLLTSIFLRRPEYQIAKDIVPYLLLANLFLGIYYNLSVWFKVTNKTYYGMYITILGSLFTVILNVILIPILGYWGSVYSTLCAYMLMTMLCYVYGQKYYPIPYATKLGITYITVTMVLVILIRSIKYSTFVSAVIYNMLFTVVFMLFMYYFSKRNKGIIEA